MNELQVFLNAIKNNRSVIKTLNLTEEYIQTLEQAAGLCGNKTWETATPISGSWETYRDRSFTVVSEKRDGTINRPTKVVRYDNGYLISNRSKELTFFDADWSFIKMFGRYGSPTINPDLYADVTGFALDADNGKIYLVCNNYHIVKAFSFPDMEPLFTIGTGTAGNVSDGRLYNPDDIVILPNGNVLVSSYGGFGLKDGIEGTLAGHVTEYDGNTGALVNTRIMGTADNQGKAWLEGVYRPGVIRLVDNLLYVSIRGRDNIGVWDITTWGFVTSYNKPTGWDVDSVSPRGLCITDNEIIICAESPGVVVGLGKDDNNYKWSVGRKAWDDKKKANNYPGDFYQPFDVLELNAELIIVLDYGNNRIQIVPKKHYINVPFNIPEIPGYRVIKESLPDEFNLEDNTLEVPLPKLTLIKPIVVAYERV